MQYHLGANVGILLTTSLFLQVTVILRFNHLFMCVHDMSHSPYLIQNVLMGYFCVIRLYSKILDPQFLCYKHISTQASCLNQRASCLNIEERRPLIKKFYNVCKSVNFSNIFIKIGLSRENYLFYIVFKFHKNRMKNNKVMNKKPLGQAPCPMLL